MEEFLKDSPSDNNNYGNERPMDPQNQQSGQLDDIGLGYTNNNYVPPNYISPQLDQQELRNDGYGDFTNPINTLNDPFLDDLENLTFPQNAMGQPQTVPQFVGAASNLDEIISPQNNDTTNNTFLNPRYFSPPNRNIGNNFNSLNSIAEDDKSDAFSRSFEGPGSLNVPGQYDNGFDAINAPDLNTGSYLSPQTNSQYVSPNNNFDSLDTLRSPSNSYLSSPPQFHGIRAPMSSSIPINPPIKTEPTNLLSPPTTSNMSSSVPSENNARESLPTKQLTKEEKLKRRREFHNAVERRRRDLIKERIKELGMIVPPSLLNPQLCAVQMLQRNTSMNSKEVNDLIASIKVKETKPNKSTILNKAVEYIEQLKYVLETQEVAREELQNKIEALKRTTRTSTTTTNTNNDATNINNNFNDTTNINPNINNGNEYGDPPLGESFAPNDQYFNPDDFFSDMIGSSNLNMNDNTQNNVL